MQHFQNKHANLSSKKTVRSNKEKRSGFIRGGVLFIAFYCGSFQKSSRGVFPPPLCASSPTKEKKSYFDFNKK